MLGMIYMVLLCSFEVDDGVSRHSVNLTEFSCTCMKWQSTQWPCVHVAKVCEDTARDINKYCSDYFTSELGRLAYEETIYPIPTLQGPPATLDEIGNLPSKDPSSLLSHILPPRTRPRTGRPKRRRIESQEVPKRPLRCSRRGIEGHNRLTCNAIIRKMDYWPLKYVFVLTSFQEESYTHAKIMGPC